MLVCSSPLIRKKKEREREREREQKRLVRDKIDACTAHHSLFQDVTELPDTLKKMAVLTTMFS